MKPSNKFLYKMKALERNARQEQVRKTIEGCRRMLLFDLMAQNR